MAKKKKTRRKVKAKPDISQTALALVEQVIGGRLVKTGKTSKRRGLGSRWDD